MGQELHESNQKQAVAENEVFMLESNTVDNNFNKFRRELVNAQLKSLEFNGSRVVRKQDTSKN